MALFPSFLYYHHNFYFLSLLHCQVSNSLLGIYLIANHRILGDLIIIICCEINSHWRSFDFLYWNTWSLFSLETLPNWIICSLILLLSNFINWLDLGQFNCLCITGIWNSSYYFQSCLLMAITSSCFLGKSYLASLTNKVRLNYYSSINDNLGLGWKKI
jgi:hypothetical protein